MFRPESERFAFDEEELELSVNARPACSHGGAQVRVARGRRGEPLELLRWCGSVRRAALCRYRDLRVNCRDRDLIKLLQTIIFAAFKFQVSEWWY